MAGGSKNLRERLLGIANRGVEKLFADDRRAARVMSALGALQKARAQLEQGQQTALHAGQFATRTDFRKLSKRAAALTQRARSLERRLADVGANRR